MYVLHTRPNKTTEISYIRTYTQINKVIKMSLSLKKLRGHFTGYDATAILLAYDGLHTDYWQMANRSF